MFKKDDPRFYTHQKRLEIGFSNAKEWRHATPTMNVNFLTILGHPVMERWEEPYMKKLAKIATQNGGVVLEVGFGMGISAKYIQEAANLEKHLIIEANEKVYQNLTDFAAQADKKVVPYLGFWEDIVPILPDNCLDGILFDTYPLHDAEIHTNHFSFFKHAYRLLKTGGYLTYYSDEIDSFSLIHIAKLQEAGFTKIRGEVCHVQPPLDCSYWKSNTILSPIVEK